MNGKYRFVRDVPRALLKYGWASTNRGKPNSKKALGYLYAKTLSMAYEYAGVPIMGDFLFG